eukprot:scaffold550_cov238-Pinguiococcus_pyrenoidosus.AAC.6
MHRATALWVALGVLGTRAAPLDGGAPEQRHLALGVAANVASCNGAALTWVTSLGSPSGAEVRVSAASAAEVLQGGGKRYTGQKYDYSYTDERRSQFYQSGDMYRVFLPDLTPRTTYWYAVDGAPDDVRAFTTGPAAGDASDFNANAQLEVAIMGDLGQTYHSVETVRRACPSCATVGSGAVGRDEPAFALIVGDLAYADGDPERWDEWGRVVEPLASRMPLMFMPGNHEIEIDEDTQEPFVNYRNRYVMSQAQEELLTPGQVFNWRNYDFNFTYEGGSSYYSYDVGRAHFVMLNTYVDTAVGSQQYNWLLNDLASLDRSATPWVFAFFHGPWYNSNSKHQNEVATGKSREAMEPLIYQYKVSMVFAGHVHSYESTYPVYKDEVKGVGEAPVYVVVGDGGNHEGLYDVFHPQPWTAYHNGSSYGHGRLKIMDDSTATWEWFPNTRTTAEDRILVKNLYQPPDEGNGDGDATDVPVEYLVAGVVGGAVVMAVLVACAVVFARRRQGQAVEKKGLVASAAEDEKATFAKLKEEGKDATADPEDELDDVL